ncbi:tetratricopeptide repeat protein [Variovorax sp. PvP013]|uniref:tetratricopeptide repeat protein n=1 Tax=Variovorax sp. PvP013 TaxID=3156435 RepID=UPI003D252727
MLLALLACAASTWVWSAPRVPAHDDDVIEKLPFVAGWANDERRLRRELAQRPRDAETAIAVARSYLELARSQGDARYAGQAIGALQAWQPISAVGTPASVMVMHATVAQFLHDFNGAESTLRAALRREPTNPQASITLATILRVQGRYAESDTACRALGPAGQALYEAACLAENAGLRGEQDAARSTLRGLLATPALQGTRHAGTRQWLLTSIAEVEELAGRPAAAEAAYREALATERSGYLLLAISDFMLRQGRPAEVAGLLAREPRSDAVLLRLASARPYPAGASSGPRESPEATELRARFEAAALRPGTTTAHAREEAMFALDVQGDARRALALARANVSLQREPIDLLLFARAAVAARDDAARQEVGALMKAIGLRDARVDAVL